MQTTFGPRHFRTTDLPTDKLIRFTLNFPQYAEYIEECYSRGIYTTQSTTAWAPLGNYLSAPTLLFLFTNAPYEDMALELTSKNYFLPSLMTAFYQPCNLTLNPLNLPTVYTNLDDQIPLSSSVTSLLPQISSLWGDLHKSVLSRNDGKIFEIMVPYTEELIRFEIYASVACGRHTLDFKETPSAKLYYPEPFVATPSFVHEDVWFLHILLYAHWLWFFFIALIILFFITFINTVRWCNYRVRPKRETRGVSRSKCADLIVVCIPISWTIALIVSESTDTSDPSDPSDCWDVGAFHAGIRTHQWGWGPHYPKGMDLSRSGTSTYSSCSGQAPLNTTTKKLWQHYLSADRTNFATSPTYGTSSQHNSTSKLANQPNTTKYVGSVDLKTSQGYNTSSTTRRPILGSNTPRSRTNTQSNLKPTTLRSSYFRSPTSYIEYNLANHKQARQVERLFWEEKSNSQHKHALGVTTRTYDDYLKRRLLQRLGYPHQPQPVSLTSPLFGESKIFGLPPGAYKFTPLPPRFTEETGMIPWEEKQIRVLNKSPTNGCRNYPYYPGLGGQHRPYAHEIDEVYPFRKVIPKWSLPGIHKPSLMHIRTAEHADRVLPLPRYHKRGFGDRGLIPQQNNLHEIEKRILLREKRALVRAERVRLREQAKITNSYYNRFITGSLNALGWQ